MNRILFFAAGILPTVCTALAADDCCPGIRKAEFPGARETVVVAEGQFEPRSTGSYSLRVYAGRDPRFPYDDFVTGIVRPRDGTVENIGFSDLDRDGLPDIIVVIRSAGTGNHLSADAFRLRAGVLTLLGSVSGLAEDADPAATLESRITNGAGLHAEPDGDDADKRR